MPSKHAKPDSLLEQALEALSDGLTACQAPCTPESLVVFKAIAGRPKDVEDAEALLALYPDINRERVRRRVAELSELAEAPEILTALDDLLART